MSDTHAVHDGSPPVAYLSIRDVADRVALSRSTVAADIARGRLRAIKRGYGRGCRVLVAVEDYLVYVEAIRRESHPMGPAT